jgi:hypothetical protein
MLPLAGGPEFHLISLRFGGHFSGIFALVACSGAFSTVHYDLCVLPSVADRLFHRACAHESWVFALGVINAAWLRQIVFVLHFFVLSSAARAFSVCRQISVKFALVVCSGIFSQNYCADSVSFVF